MTGSTLKYYLLSLAALCSCIIVCAQLGAPVYLQDFGVGNANPGTIGTPLPPWRTSYSFSSELCPPAGSYTIVRRVNIAGCFNNEWIPLSRDNSFKDFGNLMLVNYTTNVNPKVLYIDTITKPTCPGTRYQFSMDVINTDYKSTCNPGPTFPVFALVVENIAGQLMFSDTTHGGIGYANPEMIKYVTRGVGFTMPPGLNPLVIKIMMLPSSADCGEDFAIDNIMLAPLGPKVNIAFATEPSTTIVKSVCFYDNRSITINGVMDSYYNVPALQWQQSTDFGNTWTDIPGATSATYTGIFSVPDTFLIRLSGAEAANIANPYCRVISNLLRIEVDDLPRNTNASNNSPLCAGQDLKMTAQNGASYSWFGPNGFNDVTPFPHIFLSSLDDSGWYYVNVRSLGGCVIKDSTYVTMIGTDVHAWPDTAICKGKSVVLRASTGTGYEWTPATGLSGTKIAFPKATPDVTTEYTVKVTDSFGCSDTAKVTVRIINKVAAKAIITATNYLCRSVDSVSFVSSSSGAIDTWHWDFGNGQESDEAEPPVQYFSIPDGASSIIAKLSIRDTSGCADTAFHVMTIADNCYIAVPTGFTPNGDGRNDYLYPLNAYKARNLLFQVFTRNGQLVFETRDWTRKWDGKLNGVEQGMGVYAWILTYLDPSGKKVFLKGTTTLIR